MKQIAKQQAWFTAAAVVAIFALTGCGRDDVKVYHVDANDSTAQPPPPATAAMPATMPGGLPAPDNSGLPKLQYTLPAGWTEKAPTQMRVASFEVSQGGKTADVSVVPLGAMSGGDAANVTRWRGQIGQPPVTDADLPKLSEKVEIAGQSADLYDLAGASSGSGDTQRILGAILHRDEAVWFFKMTGESALVESQKVAFVSFLKSVQFGPPGGTPAAMDMSQLPASHPPIDSLSPATPAAMTAGGDLPTWTVPAGWQTGPLAQFLVAKFIIPGTAANTLAEVNVGSLSNAGGLLANVNRWRSQLALEPVDDAGLGKVISTLDAGGIPATVVDFSGTDPKTGKPARLVGVIVPRIGQTWFYKLMGDAELVAQQKDALMQFVKSAKYPGAQ